MNQKVLPILRLAVLCDQIGTDSTGRPYFCVPIHTLVFPNLEKGRRYRPPTLHVYAQLQEAVGPFRIHVVLRREHETIDLYDSDAALVEFNGTEYQNYPLELDMPLIGLELPGPGHYELYLFANYVNLHDPERQPGWTCPPMRFTVLPPTDGKDGVQ
jgi:hypothetical protein